MEKEEERRIKEKLQFFLDEKVKVHIERIDRKFWNGYLVKKKNENIYEFKEDKLGICHLFISDIYDLEEFREANR